MKRAILSAVTAAMFFAACNDKEDLIPQNQVQDEQIVNEVIQSNVITLEEARKDLESLLKDFSSLSKRGGDDFSSKKISDGFTLKSDKRSISKSTEETPEAKIHVFNFENNGGFAIMSATRDMPELLAITEGGSIDTNQVIDDPGLIIFLKGLLGKIIDPQYPIPGPEDDPTILKQYEPIEYKLYNPVGGYCKVKWGQESPYNKFCYTKEGFKAPTGCVATACAQLMSIHQYPSYYNGYNFDWYGMKNGREDTSIARLMQLLGTEDNLNMEYGIIESGAYIDSIPKTFSNFGYASGGYYIDYQTDAVCMDLEDGFPVILAGYRNKNLVTKKNATDKLFGLNVNAYYVLSNGHCWLAHGMIVATEIVKYIQAGHVIKQETTKNNYILCNFGWNGSHDGYYLSGVFDTDKRAMKDNFVSKSYNYQYGVCAIKGIRKTLFQQPLFPYFAD